MFTSPITIGIFRLRERPRDRHLTTCVKEIVVEETNGLDKRS